MNSQDNISFEPWCLQDAQLEYPLPGKNLRLDRAELRQTRVALVFGERKAGRTEFARWWARTISESAVAVHCRPADRYQIQIPNNNSPPEWAHALAKARNAAEVSNCLAQLPNGQQYYLGVNLLDQDSDRPLADTLRAFVETHPQARVLVTSNNPRLFYPEVGSGLYTHAHVWRLPWVPADTVAAWKKTSRTILPDFKSWLQQQLGGQPLLTEEYLKLFNAHPEVDRDRLLSQLIESPPPIANEWANSLVELLRVRPDLQTTLDSYLRGRRINPRFNPIENRERDLFFAGWVGPDADDLWSIRSTWHQEWAARALERVL